MFDKLHLRLAEPIPIFPDMQSGGTYFEGWARESITEPVNLSGRETGHLRSVIGVPQIIFKCQGRSTGENDDNLSVTRIDINPSGFPSFAAMINTLININLFHAAEETTLTRIDYAVDVPMGTNQVIRGTHFANRSVNEHYSFETARAMRQHILGSRNNGDCLAIYDRGRVLRDRRRRGYNPELAEALPPQLTRMERRLLKNSKIPEDIRRMNNFFELVPHVRRILSGEYNPFEPVHLYDIDIPHVTQPNLNREDWNDNTFKQRVRQYVSDIMNAEFIRGMFEQSSYPKVLSRVRNNRYGRYFDQLNFQEPYDLHAMLCDNLRAYFGEVLNPDFEMTGVWPLFQPDPPVF